MKEKVLKNIRRAAAGTLLLSILAAHAITAYADTFTSVFGGNSLEYDSEYASISTEQGETIYDYAINKEDYTNYAPADGNEISEERLADGVIEYDELGTLIQKYNITVINIRNSISSNADTYETVKDDFLTEFIDSKLTAEDAKDDGDAEEYALYTGYKAVYKAAVQSYNDVIENLSSHSSMSSLKTTEQSLTYAAQSLMVSYNTLKLTEDTLTKSLELYEALYDNTSLMVTAGSATEADLMAAYDDVQSAEVALSTIKASETEIYNTLINLLGLDPSAGYTLGGVPDPDTGYFAEIDTDTDQALYIDNDSSVQSARKSNNSYAGNSYTELKEASTKEAEGSAEVGYRSLYSSLKEAQDAYESALLGYQASLNDWNIAQSKNSLGMLSKAELVQAELSFISGSGELDSARMGLFNTLNEYQWALLGVG